MRPRSRCVLVSLWWPRSWWSRGRRLPARPFCDPSVTRRRRSAIPLCARHQPPVSVRADASGGFSIDASGAGPFSLGVIATGFNSQAVGGVTPGRSVQVVLSASTYVPLGLYDGSSQEVVADVRSGMFYSLMRGAQEVYLTVDYGGRWQPVT